MFVLIKVKTEQGYKGALLSDGGWDLPENSPPVCALTRSGHGPDSSAQFLLNSQVCCKAKLLKAKPEQGVTWVYDLINN